MKIEEVVIRGVRGIRHELTLGLGGRSLLLHGDNGTGKSSVERALRWALLGEDEPTDEAPYASESSFRRNVLVEPSDPRVRVTFKGGGEIEVVPGEVRADKNGARARTACKRGVPFLRRRELLNVLRSRPVDRFRYFEGFLGLDRVDGLLEGLKDSKAALERRKSAVESSLTSELQALRPLLPEDLQDETDSMDSLESAASDWATRLSLCEGASGWEEIATAVAAAAEGSPEDVERSRAVVMSIADELEALKDRWASETLELPEAIAEDVARQSTDLDENQLDLLRHAEHHFSAATGEVCPVCEQPVDWTKTAERLRERVDELSELADLLDEQRGSQRRWLTRWDEVSRLRDRAAAELGADAVEWTALGDLPTGADLLTVQVTDTDEQSRLAAVLAIGGDQLQVFLHAVLDELRERLRRAAEQHRGVAGLPEVSLCASLFDRFGEARPSLLINESEVASITEELSILSTVYEAFRKARQDVAKETLGNIATKVSEYYFAIHPRENPDEVTGAPSIDVQRHSGGSAFVRGVFADKEVRDPRWVYSDGHLDTVGICIFLALRRYRASDEDDAKLLVLDDIVISIDLGHARRLLMLLRDEFSDHQIFMLTHNGLFAHWCADFLSNLARFEVKSWSLETGPRIGEFMDSYSRVEKSLDKGSPKQISQHMMTLLDEWLAEARYSYQLSVPARRGEAYTLTEIWQPFAKAIRKLAKRLDSDLGGSVDLLKELTDIPRIRNYLAAHENEFAREFPRSTIRDVAQATLDLVSALYCSECRTFAEPFPRRTNASIAHCRCRRLQYAPPSRKDDSEE